jgi:recombinational DNA repair ATPase RecF
MRLSRLWLQDFRCYDAVDVAFDEGCTVVTGANGQGKTSLLEAVAWALVSRGPRCGARCRGA